MMQFKSILLLVIAVAVNLAVVHCQGAVCRADRNLISLTSGDRGRGRPPVRCEDGPVQKIHTVSNEFHWPPIYKGSCKNLKCEDPPCIARKAVWRFRCVLVYRKIFGHWVRIGYRIRRYWDVLKCSCKQCSDIKTQKECASTKPCPNQNNPKYFCFWKKKCDCCIPKNCPRGQIFDRASCSCVCPKGSSLIRGKCIGDCSDISLDYCKFVTCKANPFFKCFVRNYKCNCPSCDAQRNVRLCPKTRCLEKRSDPYCVYDIYTKKCRCPECRDKTSLKQCVTSNVCNYASRCKYNFYTKKCFCPAH